MGGGGGGGADRSCGASHRCWDPPAPPLPRGGLWILYENFHLAQVIDVGPVPQRELRVGP